MRLSFAIVSHNRRSLLLSTLAALSARAGVSEDQWEISLVDNASIDGSANAVRDRYPNVKLISLNENAGRDAMTLAVGQCSGEYVICLSEGSVPGDAGVVSRMIEHLDAHPGVGAIVANVLLPDGSSAAPMLPSLVMAGATCYRRELLQAVMTGNEWELSFRIWSAGYRVERFEDLVFELPSPRETSRAWLNRQVREITDRLCVADQYLPENLARAYRADWLMRYSAIARQNGIARQMQNSITAPARESSPLHFSAIESIFGLHHQARLVGQWATRNNIRRVALAGLGDNVHATHAACCDAGLEISGVAVQTAAFSGLSYRGSKIVGMSDPLVRYVDGVIATSANPSEIDQQVEQVKRVFNGPVLRLWEPKLLQTPVRRYQIAA